MTSVAGIGGTQTAVATPAAVAARAATASSQASAAAFPLQNPRVVQDPVAGQITQYLNLNGSQVVSQVPSERAVEYLKLGLTVNGAVKASASVEKTA